MTNLANKRLQSKCNEQILINLINNHYSLTFWQPPQPSNNATQDSYFFATKQAKK